MAALPAGTVVTIKPKHSDAYAVEILDMTPTTLNNDIRYTGNVSRETVLSLGKADPGQWGLNIFFYHSDIVTG